MSLFSLGQSELDIPKSVEDFKTLIAGISEKHGKIKETALLFALTIKEKTGKRVNASMVQEGKFGTLHLLFELLGRPDFSKAGFIKKDLDDSEVDALLSAFSPFLGESEKHPNILFLKDAKEKKSPISCTIINKEIADENLKPAYLRERTTIMFDAFNEGSLRGSDSAARQALLDSFSILPNRFLDSNGYFVTAGENASQYTREMPEQPASTKSDRSGAIDKFPSLMSVRGDRLKEDANRLIPGVMIRDGVHIGKRNIFMFHAAVNIAAYIGDDNLVDSHASIASSAQVGNRNKIGSFVSLEGVLSPANAEPVYIGDDNFIGTFVRIGTGIKVGNKNFIGAGVNIALGTKIRDCRETTSTKGEYVTPRDLNPAFHNLAIVPNNAVREFHGVNLQPGEYLVFENTEEFMDRFTGDTRIKAK